MKVCFELQKESLDGHDLSRCIQGCINVHPEGYLLWYMSTSCRQIFMMRIGRNTTTMFILVQPLSKSNSPMSSIIVLYWGKLVAPDKLQAATYIDY
jgi:hypothetical protein